MSHLPRWARAADLAGSTGRFSYGRDWLTVGERIDRIGLRAGSDKLGIGGPQSGRNSTADAVGVPVKLPDQPNPAKVMACAAGSSLVMVKPAAGRVARR